MAQALEATFRRRRTPLPDTIPPGLSDAFAEDPAKRAQWSAFVGRLRLRGEATASLLEVAIRTRRFLLPVVEDLVAGRTWIRDWPAGGPWKER